jgi:hypothetical protein
MTLGVVSAVALVVTSSVTTAETIYRNDPPGNETPAFTYDGNGRWIQTDRFRNKLYHLDQYKVEGDRVYEVDAYGNTKYHEPSFRLDD